MENRNFGFIDGFTLKLIAIICMLIDHIGAVIFPDIVFLRIIGRIAFPIFCFLLVEGFFHTQSHINYFIRLALFALLSEIPFNLAFYGSLLYPAKQNVFFTLALGLICLFCLEEMNTNQIFVIPLVLIWILAYFIHCDYGVAGVILICLFYMTTEMPPIRLLLSALLLYYFFGTRELYAMIAFIPIALYNGKRGPSVKMFFYWFYPLHLLILYALSIL